MHPQTVQAAILCNPGAPSTCPGPCCHLSFWVVGMTCYKNLVFFGLHLVPILQCASRPADRMPPPAATRNHKGYFFDPGWYEISLCWHAITGSPEKGQAGPPIRNPLEPEVAPKRVHFTDLLSGPFTGFRQTWGPFSGTRFEPWPATFAESRPLQCGFGRTFASCLCLRARIFRGWISIRQL